MKNSWPMIAWVYDYTSIMCSGYTNIMTTGCTSIVRGGCTCILLSNWSPRFYRAKRFLAANRRAIEEAVYCRMTDLLYADVELIFYGTVSLHFETDDEDESRDRPAADGRDNRVLRKRGMSKIVRNIPSSTDAEAGLSP